MTVKLYVHFEDYVYRAICTYRGLRLYSYRYIWRTMMIVTNRMYLVPYSVRDVCNV